MSPRETTLTVSRPSASPDGTWARRDWIRAAVSVPAVAGIAAAATPADDYSWIRGANYVPSYATTDVETWLHYDPDVIERELGYAERLKLNSLRIFLQYLVWEHDPESFKANLKDFVTRCARRGIRPMLVLFDSCFGTDASLESSGFWVANLGPSRMHRDFWPQVERYARDVVGHFRGDSRILIWDVMNEPQATWLMGDDEGKRAVWDFCLHLIDFVRALDAETPITVGVIGSAYEEVADKVDILSLHSYARGSEETLEEMHKVREDAHNHGKPAVITECCFVGTYASTLERAREVGLGWYFWELMIGKDQFRSYQGLVYPDGSVRRWDEIRAVLGEEPQGFVVKPDTDGVIPDGGRGFGPPVRTMLARMLRTPATAANLRERYTFIYGLARVGFFNDLTPDAAWVREAESHTPSYSPAAADTEAEAVQGLLLALDQRVRTRDEHTQPDRSLLAIFAHPDDEAVVGPVLAKYAREGTRVHLAVATSGQAGKRPGIAVARGEPLGRTRESEVICSCRELGIRPPILLRYQDGQLVQNAHSLAAAVRKLFRTLDPQVVITWGPEGLYGHPDHRAVSNVVTEVFLSQAPGRNWPRALYYPAIPAERMQQTPPPEGSTLLPVAEAHLPVRIAYAEEDYRRALRSLQCHETQFNPEQMLELMEFKRKTESGEAYMRPAIALAEQQEGLFE